MCAVLCVGMGIGRQRRGQDTGTEKVGDRGERWSKAAYVRCLGADGAAEGAEELWLHFGPTRVQYCRQRAQHRSFLFFLMTCERVLVGAYAHIVGIECDLD